MIDPKRLERIKAVVANRQFDLTVVLENVHDTHNIGAVMRSCDSVGIQEIFVLYTDPNLNKEKIKLGKRTSAGARKWLDVHLYNDPAACFQHLRQHYQTVLASQVEEASTQLYDLDLCRSTALIFGNEHDGVSPEVRSYADGTFYIPQQGMVQSLNISVACAVTLFEAMRQRHNNQAYPNQNPTDAQRQKLLLEEFLRRHENRDSNRLSFRKD